MIYVGIDPGKTGAVAVLMKGASHVEDTPVMGTRAKPGSYSPALMMALLLEIEEHARTEGIHVIIELQQSMPKQGVASTFQTGYGYGLWIGMISALGWPYTVVRALEWKRSMMTGLDKTDKSSSRILAQRLFPDLASRLIRVGDHGRAESLLLGEYGRRLLTPSGRKV